tara:strand:- start:2535 stop:3020 length:486 start_codon:yes stop_codon:yes gene_type:complete
MTKDNTMKYDKNKYRTITERIHARCEKSGDCLVWTGAKHRQGYGMSRVNGKMTTVHQAIGKEKYGAPENTRVHKFTHTCGNILCCNPEHIVLTTHQQVMEKASKHRKPKRCLNGVITEQDIRDIRAMPYENWANAKRIAKGYGISPITVVRIIKRETYANI